MSYGQKLQLCCCATIVVSPTVLFPSKNNYTLLQINLGQPVCCFHFSARDQIAEVCIITIYNSAVTVSTSLQRKALCITSHGAQARQVTQDSRLKVIRDVDKNLTAGDVSAQVRSSLVPALHYNRSEFRSCVKLGFVRHPTVHWSDSTVSYMLWCC